MEVAQRFFNKVQVTGFCWEWTGGTDKAGYGRFWLNKNSYAHIVAYELLVGSVPEGLELDHLCKNRACVNPDHLEAVTKAENIARAVQYVREICKRGHDKQGKRACKLCQQMTSKIYYNENIKAKRK